MEKDYILLKDLAQELSMDRSHARRYVLKNDIPMFKVRTAESQGQPTLALTPEDAEAVRELRQSQGYAVGGRPGEAIINNHCGWFYVIQLVPELDPGRAKVGFANDVEARLSSHRTAAPTAELVKVWPCKRSWETAAIASLTREGCESLSAEVFKADDLDSFIKRGDAFFSLMPKK